MCNAHVFVGAGLPAMGLYRENHRGQARSYGRKVIAAEGRIRIID